LSQILAVPKKAHIHNERQLLSEVADGNERSFALLYQHYYDQLFPYFSKFTGNALYAQEILQGTFMRVWMNRDRLPEIENFRAWIYKIATRENLSLLRREMLAVKKISQLASLTKSPVLANGAFDAVETEELEQEVRELAAVDVAWNSPNVGPPVIAAHAHAARDELGRPTCRRNNFGDPQRPQPMVLLANLADLENRAHTCRRPLFTSSRSRRTRGAARRSRRISVRR